MAYIRINNNRALAEEISEKLYELSRPPEVRNPQDKTRFLGTITTHPVTGQHALRLPPFAVAIHSDARDDILDFFVDLLGLPSATNVKNAMRQRIVNARATNTPIINIFPPSIQNRIISREDMENDGWFNREEE